MEEILGRWKDGRVTDGLEDEEGAEHEHQWGAWEITAATCIASGEETRVCALDASHIETKILAVDPDAHAYGDWQVTAAPSYTTEGEEARLCAYNIAHTVIRLTPRTAITSAANLTAILEALPGNSADTPYTIALSVLDLNSVADAINDSGKYVSLDFSGSTFTNIGKETFLGCTVLTGVIIPNGVTGIASWAFEGCTSLTSVIIPNSVNMIGEAAFKNTNLSSVIIPNSVTDIWGEAFLGTGLTSITIPNSVAGIGDMAFYKCESLTRVTFAGKVDFISDTSAFDGNLTEVYNSGGPGTYTRASGSSTTWTKL
jgi:hypothetical protein